MERWREGIKIDEKDVILTNILVSRVLKTVWLIPNCFVHRSLIVQFIIP